MLMLYHHPGSITFVSDTEPILPPSTTTITVCVVVPPEVCTVPVSLGNVIVLSTVGSTTVNVFQNHHLYHPRIRSYHLLLHSNVVIFCCCSI